MDRAYELFKYDGKRWRLVEQFAFLEKARAYRRATELQAQRDCEGVRLVSERYDSATGETLQVIAIDTGPKDTVGPGDKYGGDELFNMEPAPAPWRAQLDPPSARPNRHAAAPDAAGAELGSTLTKMAFIAIIAAVVAAISGYIVHSVLGLPAVLAVLVPLTVSVGVFGLGFAGLARAGQGRVFSRFSGGARAAGGAGGGSTPLGDRPSPERWPSLALSILRDNLAGIDLKAGADQARFGTFLFMVGVCEALAAEAGGGEPTRELLKSCGAALSPERDLVAAFIGESEQHMANPEARALIVAGRAAAGDALGEAAPRGRLRKPLAAWLQSTDRVSGPECVRAALWTDMGAAVERQRDAVDPAVRAMIRLHGRVVREALAQAGAIGLRGGDGGGVGGLFTSAGAALLAARAIRAALSGGDRRGAGPTIPVRIGLVDGDFAIDDAAHIDVLLGDALDVCQMARPSEFLMTYASLADDAAKQNVIEFATRVIGPLARSATLYRWLDAARSPGADKPSAAA